MFSRNSVSPCIIFAVFRCNCRPRNRCRPKQSIGAVIYLNSDSPAGIFTKSSRTGNDRICDCPSGNIILTILVQSNCVCNLMIWIIKWCPFTDWRIINFRFIYRYSIIAAPVSGNRIRCRIHSIIFCCRMHLVCIYHLNCIFDINIFSMLHGWNSNSQFSSVNRLCNTGKISVFIRCNYYIIEAVHFEPVSAQIIRKNYIIIDTGRWNGDRIRNRSSGGIVTCIFFQWKCTVYIHIYLNGLCISKNNFLCICIKAYIKLQSKMCSSWLFEFLIIRIIFIKSDNDPIGSFLITECISRKCSNIKSSLCNTSRNSQAVRQRIIKFSLSISVIMKLQIFCLCKLNFKCVVCFRSHLINTVHLRNTCSADRSFRSKRIQIRRISCIVILNSYFFFGFSLCFLRRNVRRCFRNSVFRYNGRLWNRCFFLAWGFLILLRLRCFCRFRTFFRYWWLHLFRFLLIIIVWIWNRRLLSTLLRCFCYCLLILCILGVQWQFFCQSYDTALWNNHQSNEKKC